MLPTSSPNKGQESHLNFPKDNLDELSGVQIALEKTKCSVVNLPLQLEA